LIIDTALLEALAVAASTGFNSSVYKATSGYYSTVVEFSGVASAVAVALTAVLVSVGYLSYFSFDSTTLPYEYS
jgi:hypothetical protein